MKGFINRYLTIIDRYLIGKYLGTFFFTLLIVISISVVFDVSEHLDNFLTHHRSIWEIMWYYTGFIPFFMDMLSPLITFLAVIFFTAKMANQTEIVPILSSRASFNRFLRPYFLSATLIFFISLIGKLYIIPVTNQIKVKFENENGFNGEYNVKNEVHLQLDKDTYVYVQSFDKYSKTGYQFVLEKFNGDDLKKRIVSNSISYDSVKRVWSLHDYSVRYVNGLNEKLVEHLNKDTVLNMQPSDFEIVANTYSAMSLKELNRRIDQEKIRGSGDLKDMVFEKYRRFFYPFAAYVLTIIGVSISSRKVRGGVGLPLGIGLALCFAYIVVDKFSLVFAIKGGLSPIIATMIPNALFGVIGLYLLYKAPK
ncbi:LptF/LptG family permease [Mucilaginibacter auburnensis]|uniref:Lipopolysaccharide export system permease protein n=1 Tax=Mucilaginibacter auburnensis TaxID=1457233 RepID=A0A2H9VUD6_9SPHI|nr:LptF/LptG family permease [Mucilaginibacter auburnensis]PJJ84409.1 lipopolysaccharide export system permease protein [Mucilaginibacter auburnensis]